MTNPEQLREVENKAMEACVEWMYTELLENSGFEFDRETEILPTINKYLEENNRSVLGLTELDKDNICSDLVLLAVEE